MPESPAPFVHGSSSLASEDRGAGVLVRGGDGPVDVDLDAGVGGAVGSRESNLVGRLGAAAAGHGDLGARDVELGASDRRGRVQRDVLGAEQVVAGPDAAGNGDGKGALACERGMFCQSLRLFGSGREREKYRC